MNRVSLGQYIREIRRQSGLSTKDLAQSIARSETWLYRLEHGQRAEPLDVDLAAIAIACNLNPIEKHYLYLLAGRIPPSEKVADPGFREYLESFGGPAAWIDGYGASVYNRRFCSLFKGVESWHDVVNWHFGCPEARRILLNWDEIAGWWAGVARLYLAGSGNDPLIHESLGLLLENDDFRKHWAHPGVLRDPSHRLWYVVDADRGAELEIDMRLWKHPAGSGGLLAGFVRTGDPPAVAESAVAVHG